MKKNPTLIVLAALLFVFGYYTWEYFSKKDSTTKGEDEEAPKDRIDLAVQQEIKRTKDPNTNSVPVERLIQAKMFKDQKLSQLNNNRVATSVPGINWTERGPANVGGRSRVIWYDFNDATNGYKKVWAGSVGGGLWYTNDISVGSPIWNKVNDLFDNIAITSFAQNSSSPNTMYFGTGEGWFNADAIEGLGIWKSINGGSTWSQLPSTLSFAYVQDLLIDQNGHLYASVRNRTGSQARGIQKSTDGGTTWTQVLGAPLAGFVSGRGCDLEAAANGDIYASLGNFSEGRIYRSSFSVNGVNTGSAGTWTDITPNPTTNLIPATGDNYDRIELATAPSNGNVVYGIFEGNGTNNVSNIKQYDAATNTWTSRTVPSYSGGGPYTRGQAWYDLIATVDQNNANTLYIGAIDVYKSTNNGANWDQVSDWRPIGLPYVHADIHQITYAPGSSSRMAIGCDGGIFYSTDANLASPGFAEKNSGYNVTQFYSVAIHPSLPNFFLAGAQDNGSQKFTSAGVSNTTEVTGGDGAFCHIDQDNPNIQITAYVYNNYFISTNGGTTFSTLYDDPDPNGGSGDFINPTDYDNTANVLYGCSSEDIDPAPGSTAINYQYNRYTRITGVGSTNTASLVTLTNSPTTALITNVTVSPTISNRVYFGFDNGSIGYVNNANTGTSNTINLFASTGIGGSVSCVAIDPTNENHILATYSNYGVNSIWETTNGGGSWTSIEGNLPDIPVRWAMFDPRNSDWALIATELGIWSTDNINGGSTDWDPTNSGLANVRVDMLQYRSSDRTIAAATHGRGLYTAVVPSTTTPDISFAASSASVTEQTTSTSGCRSYTDYTINMQIANAPTGDATITVGVQGGSTAIQGKDYDFTTNGNFVTPTNTFVFPGGAAAPKTINLRIYDDTEVEVEQSFTLTYTISGTTNAQAGSSNQTYTLTIDDNDSAPTGASSLNYTVSTYDINSSATSPFQGGSRKARSQYIITSAELVAAGLVVNRQITALEFNVVTKNSTQAFTGYTISMANTSNTNLGSGFISPSLTQVYSNNYTVPNTGWQTIAFTTPFTWDGANLLVQVCFDNGNGSPTSSIDVVQGTAAPLGVGTRATAIATATGGGAGCALSSGIGVSDSRPQFRFTQAVPQTPVETVLNSSKSVYLGPNADVYLYSSTDGELLARIENLSSHDYGCTSIEIDRAGTGSTQFWNTNASNYLMNKTFRVIPTNNNPSGQYTITLYLTPAEVNGWQTATGQSWASIQFIKLPSQISNVTPSTPEPDGAGTVQVVSPTLGMLGTCYTMSYTFSNGFSGFGAGIPGQGTLPIELLSFNGSLQSENVKLNWSTAFEQNSKGFEIEKSHDGINFHSIGFVASAGNSGTTRNYTFTDPQRAVERNYYRLKLVDIDNTFDYSDVVLVKNTVRGQDVYLVGNPITNNINIQFAKIPYGKVAVSIYDMKGSKIYEATYKNYTQTSLQINTANKLLAHGVYSLKIETGGKIYNLKAIK